MADTVILELYNDLDGENPCEPGEAWNVYSFNSRLTSYKHPDHFRTEGGQLRMWLRNKLRVGLAFPLSYYEHGDGMFSLRGEGPQCQFDSVGFAGFLIWEGKPTDMGHRTREERADYARRFLEGYNAWANGHVYGFVLEGEDGTEIHGSGNYTDDKEMFAEISSVLEDGQTVKVKGDAMWLLDYNTLKLDTGHVTVEKMELTESWS